MRYEYKRLEDPSDEELNALGHERWWVSNIAKNDKETGWRFIYFLTRSHPTPIVRIEDIGQLDLGAIADVDLLLLSFRVMERLRKNTDESMVSKLVEADQRVRIEILNRGIE